MATSGEGPPIRLHINVEDMTLGDQMDLEAAAASESVTAMCTWLVDHAGVTMDELRPLKAKDLATLFDVLTTQVKAETQPSKSNGATSSSPSRGARVPRRRG